MRRFGVTTVTGYRINLPIGERGMGPSPPGLSAHVIDHLYNCRVVATYRSEDRLPLKGGYRRGRRGAVRDARTHARYLEEHYG